MSEMVSLPSLYLFCCTMKSHARFTFSPFLHSILFVAEFLLGAAARSTSNKASFSPAAAAASSQNNFAIVQSNRIHQNHIESFCILGPMAVAAAASGADATTIKASVVSWVGFRFLYRLGYCYNSNPFWRIAGVAASQLQSMVCLWCWYQQGGARM